MKKVLEFVFLVFCFFSCQQQTETAQKEETAGKRPTEETGINDFNLRVQVANLEVNLARLNNDFRLIRDTVRLQRDTINQNKSNIAKHLTQLGQLRNSDNLLTDSISTLNKRYSDIHTFYFDTSYSFNIKDDTVKLKYKNIQ